MRCAYLAAVAALLCAHAGCRHAYSKSTTGQFGSHNILTARLPSFGAPRTIAPGITLREARYTSYGITRRIWLFLPTAAAKQRVPCVLVGPAGSKVIDGIDLTDGYYAETLPYARAGFAVVSYDIDGAVPDRPDPEEFLTGIREFEAADAGVSDAKAALDVAVAKAPQIDPNRIYAAGHSSAGTLALLVAERDPRIKGCAAYAPVTFVADRLGPKFINTVSKYLPSFRDFVCFCSPDTDVAALRCPVFLFHAADDTVVPSSQFQRFVALLRRDKAAVTYVEVPAGGHYYSMVHQGIPLGIRWLKGQARRSGAVHSVSGRATLPR